MNKAQALWVKRMSSAYIEVKEVRVQVPGTIRNGHAATVRPGLELQYIRAPKGVAQ